MANDACDALPLPVSSRPTDSPGYAAIHVDGGLETENGKDDDTGIDGRDCIAHGHQQDIPHTVVLRGVVAPKGNQGSEGQAEGVEDLGGRIQPHRWLQQLLHLRRVHVHQPGSGAAQRNPTNEEDGQHDVGEEGGEVDHLARALDALHHDEEDNGPGEQQAEHNPPLEAAGLVHRGSGVQGGAVPEVRRLRGLGALL